MANRKPIVITGSSAGAQTNYVLPIEIAYDADMNADFSDVYFVGVDGHSRLNFYLFTYTSSSTATFYLKVPFIPADPDTTTIYVVYDGAVTGASNMGATFINSDEFDRTNVNEPTTWTKSSNNPLIGPGYGDPCVVYQEGTYYLFVTDLTTNGIRLFTSTDPESTSWTDEGEMVALGSGGSWDDTTVRDPSVVWDGTQWVMYYAGYDGSGSLSGYKIGRATASTLDGTWTKYGSNPVASVTSASAGEPSVIYDGSMFHMLATTNGNSGSPASDSGHGYMRYFTSADGITWTNEGVVGRTDDSQQWQDQDLFYDPSTGLYHAFLNRNAAQDIHQMQSANLADWSYPTTGGGLDASGSGAEAVNIFAPSIVKVGTTYWMFYQASDGTNQRISVAYTSALTGDKWRQFHTAFDISSGELRKTSGASGAWSRSELRVPIAPPYEFEATLRVGSATGTAYTCGWFIGYDSTGLRYGVIAAPNGASNQLALWRTTQPEAATTSVLADTYTVSLTTGVNYRIRARVTSADIAIDFYNGTSWTNDILNETRTFDYGLGGYYTFANSTTNQIFGDKVWVRKRVSPEPTYSVGSEQTGQAERIPFRIIATD
jgi:hypothetical protein